MTTTAGFTGKVGLVVGGASGIGNAVVRQMGGAGVRTHVFDIKETTDTLRKAQPIQRLGTTEEIGKAVMFMLSDDCAYMTGALLSVDGGYTCQ